MATVEHPTVRVFGLEAGRGLYRHTSLFEVFRLNGLVHELSASSTGSSPVAFASTACKNTREVGRAGFEPAITWSQTTGLDQARLPPIESADA